MNKIVEEASKTVGSYFEIMRQHPLALSLVVSNLLLMGFLYWSGAQRKDTVNMIVAWQEKSDQLLAQCVSADIMQMVLQALKRNGFKPAESSPPAPIAPP